MEADLVCLVDGVTDAHIRNLSLGGALLRGPLGMAAADDTVNLEFGVGVARPVALFGDVVRVADRADHAEYGLRFLELDQHRQLLSQWIELLREGAVTATATRRVAGTLFVDYVKMLRAYKGADWSRYLEPADMTFLDQRVQPEGWYPMETFERMGVAILAEVAQDNLDMVRAWGRAQTEGLCAIHEQLVARDDPRDSLMRFRVLRNSFFDYAALQISHVSDGQAAVEVSYGMGPVAEHAAALQTMGFLEGLLDLSGAHNVRAWFSSMAWEGKPSTTVELRWEQG